MELDHDACYRAIQARDARFDGQIFTGVRTTGIYCRPVCPARTPLTENVVFYPSAAAVQAAIAQLKALPGIGEWTAHYIAMRALREPDAFPHGDIGLMRALAEASGRRPTAAGLLRGRRRGGHGGLTPRCIYGPPTGCKWQRKNDE